jgi:hypothetical protein
MHDFHEHDAPQDFVHGVAGDGGEGLIRVEEAIARGHVDTHEGLLGERVEVLLRFREESGAALHDRDDLVEGARHVPRVPGQLRARRGITRGEPPCQLDEGGVHARARAPAADGHSLLLRWVWEGTWITSPDTARARGASSPVGRD